MIWFSDIPEEQLDTIIPLIMDSLFKENEIKPTLRVIKRSNRVGISVTFKKEDDPNFYLEDRSLPLVIAFILGYRAAKNEYNKSNN